jgi:hypothetical protein
MRCLALLRVPSTNTVLPACASSHPFLRSCVQPWAETPLAAASLESLFAQPPPAPAWLTPDARCATHGAPEALWAQGACGRHRFVEALLAALLSAFPLQPLFLDAALAHALRCPPAEPTEPAAAAASGSMRYQALPGEPLNPRPVCAPASAAAAAAVKRTLAAHAQQPALWTAFAATEALRGKVSSARRVLDTVLTAAPTLPNDARRHVPVAWLSYAELELSVDATDAGGRALHLLCGLASGEAFTPPPPPPPPKRAKKPPQPGDDAAAAAAAAAPPPVDPERLQAARLALQALLEAELRSAGGNTPRSERGVAVVAVRDAKSSLGDAKSLLGDTKSSLGDAKSSLGDA